MHHVATGTDFYFGTLLAIAYLVGLVLGILAGRCGRPRMTRKNVAVWLMDRAADLDGSLDYEATILLNAANLLTGAEDDDLTLADQRDFVWPEEG